MGLLARINPADLTTSIVDTMRNPVLVLDRDLRVKFANRAFRRTFGTTFDEMVSRFVFQPGMRDLLSSVLLHNEAFYDFEISHDFESVGRRIITINARQLEEIGILLAIEDVTDRRFKEADQAYEIKALGILLAMNTGALYADDMTSLLNGILDKWIELHESDFGNIQLYDSDAQVLRIAAQRNFQSRFLEHFAAVDVGEASACGFALRKGERVIIEDVEKLPAYAPSLGVARAAGYRAVQSTPLLTREHKPLGMISTHFREPRHFEDREVRFTDLAARQSADAIRMQLLHDALENHSKVLEASEARLRHAMEAAGTVVPVIPVV